MKTIILQQHISLHNLRNATKDTTKWKDKELRMKALSCDIQDLNEVTLRIIKKIRFYILKKSMKKS